MNQDLPYKKHTHMLIQMGRYEQALMVAKKWVEAKPHEAEAWFCKSACEMMLMRAKHALDSIEKALETEPKNARFLAQKARSTVGTGAIMQGLEIARNLAKQENSNPSILDSVGLTLSNAGESEEAIPLFERAIELNPNIPQYYTNYGTVLHFCRRTEEAEAAHRKALELNPEDFRAYWLLGGLRTATNDHNFVDWFGEILKKYNDKLIARIPLHYALAKQYEDLGEFDNAFMHLEKGAAAALEHTPYNEDLANALIEGYTQHFTPDLFQGHIHGYDNDELILIVGMPRSGTTLVERIIASYDEVYAAGELHNFNNLLNERVRNLHPDKSTIEITGDLRKLDFQDLGQAYIDSTRPRTGHTKHFIDKYPFNFQLVGPFALALPKLKIINLMRNPMDTCYSNYKLLFGLGSAMYSYDQETLGRFYVGYRKMMEHWHSCLPERILDVNYENLAQNPEDESKRIMDFLGFDWRPECLEFYKSKDAVTTASTSQIREPINTSSLYKWKKFEHHLEPLKTTLLENGIDIE